MIRSTSSTINTIPWTSVLRSPPSSWWWAFFPLSNFLQDGEPSGKIDNFRVNGKGIYAQNRSREKSSKNEKLSFYFDRNIKGLGSKKENQLWFQNPFAAMLESILDLLILGGIDLCFDLKNHHFINIGFWRKTWLLLEVSKSRDIRITSRIYRITSKSTMWHYSPES